MSSSSHECPRVERRKIRAEAAAWLARLHGPNRTPAMEEGLRRWLAEHPLHAQEFELATDVWDETAGSPGAPPPRLLRPPHPVRRPAAVRMLAPLFAAAAAAILVSFWLIHRGAANLLSTGVGDQKTVILSDGSRITLNTNTQLLLNYGKHSRTVVLKYGEAYFDVVHNPSRPFVVRAGRQRVIDLGTRFVVNRPDIEHGPLTVTVIEGKVAVAPLDAPDIFPSGFDPNEHIVTAGELIRFHADALPTIHAVSIDEATAWLNGQLIFDETPLADAVAQFNRYNATKITLLSPEAATIPVGGVFRIGDSASFARAVAESHHLRLVTRDGELVLEPYVSAATQASSPHPP